MTKYDTIIQISDCHIIGDNSPKDLSATENLKKIILELNNIPYSLVIISGDISSNGSIESYKKTLEILSNIKKYHCLAGNHDNICNMKKIFPKKTLKTNININKKWRLLLVNTVVKNETYGFLNKEELDNIEKNIKLPFNYLLAMHHPPVSMKDKNWDDNYSIHNSNFFFNTINKFDNIKGVIWGHAHQGKDFKINNLELLACPSSAYTFNKEQKTGYRIINLYDNGKIESNLILFS